MSRSATPATRNEATTRLKPPKRTTSAELPIGTAIRGSRGRLRTVADGCDRERNVERTHPQPPDPQSETGTLATHSGKNVNLPSKPLIQNSEFKTGASLSRSFKHISCIPTLRKEERRLQRQYIHVLPCRCEQGVCIEARTRTYCERNWPLDATGTMHRNVLNHGVRLAMWENGRL